jgi:hypothetical protein
LIVGDTFLLVGEKVLDALARFSRRRNALSQ